MTTPNMAPKVSLVDLLAQINVKPDQIKYVGISHYHADHTGQVGSFPKATLLIGKGDWDAISSPQPIFGVTTSRSSIGPKVKERSSRCRSTRMCSAMEA